MICIEYRCFVLTPNLRYYFRSDMFLFWRNNNFAKTCTTLSYNALIRCPIPITNKQPSIFYQGFSKPSKWHLILSSISTEKVLKLIFNNLKTELWRKDPDTFYHHFGLGHCCKTYFKRIICVVFLIAVKTKCHTIRVHL